MNNKHSRSIDLLQSAYTTVSVIFDKNITDILKGDAIHSVEKPQYTYKADLSLQLQVGDFVVVHANDCLNIAKIVNIDEKPLINPNTGFEYKWVVDKIDLSRFIVRVKEQEEMSKLLEQLKLVESRISLIKRIEEVSQKDPELSRMWSTLQGKYTEK